ncbi:hypothetical protein [Pelagibacterium mangrovi]|uniref:hypothetical protein n=1 Tax=Pelagibacterium mangrovi TaxID=3119828 RepID=UPI002FC5BC86
MPPEPEEFSIDISNRKTKLFTFLPDASALSFFDETWNTRISLFDSGPVVTFSKDVGAARPGFYFRTSPTQSPQQIEFQYQLDYNTEPKYFSDLDLALKLFKSEIKTISDDS